MTVESTASSVGRSAYPFAVEDLLPQVRVWACELGRLPSRNEVMRRWKIGAPKAKQLLAELTTSEDAPVVPAPSPSGEPRPDSAITGQAVSMLTTPSVDPLSNPDQLPVVSRQSDQDHHAAHPALVRSWPLLVLAVPAFVAIWSGWVGLGNLAGFGQVRLLPGIWDSLYLNTAITLPVGVEAYAAYALKAWLTPGIPVRARIFARCSALGSLAVGMCGQIAYHLMTAAGITHAPWPITTAVACLPVAVLGMAAGLAHLLRTSQQEVTS